MKIQPSIMEIYFNRFIYNVTGLNNGKHAKVRINYFEDGELTLLPGDYELTASMPGVKTSLKVNVYQSKSTFIKINYDETRKSLKLEY
jgi:HSP20 family molecular chaperone IbpA